jgi:glycosyltransferase involved in cell wall biosynthesis
MQPTKRRTVVFLESVAAMGGVQFSTLYLARALDPSRWRPVVVCPEAGDLTRACQNAGVETQIVRSPRLWSTSIRMGQNARLPNLFAWFWNALVMLRAARTLQRFLRELSPEVVVTKGLASHFVGGFASRKASIRCVWHVQDLISERSFGIYRRIFNLAAVRLPDQIIVDGQAIKDQLPDSIQARVSVIYNGVDTNLFRPGLDGPAVRRELGIAADEIVIGNAGRITPWKGQHYLIEAFARIADDHPKAVLLLVGSPVFDHDGYERRLKSMAAEFGLESRIKFAGFRHDLPRVLSAMDVFAFTSIEKDTSPLALLSAMASGRPIVAFDIQGVRELDRTGDIFSLVPVGDVDALAQSLSALLVNETARYRLAQNARKAAEKQFSLDRYVAEFERVIITSCEFGDATTSPSSRSISARPAAESSGARAVSAIGS